MRNHTELRHESQRTENLFRIETPHGTLNLLMGGHDRVQKVPGGLHKLLEMTDVLAMEGIWPENKFDSITTNDQDTERLNLPVEGDHTLQMKEIWKQAKEMEIPVFIPDVSSNMDKPHTSEMLEGLDKRALGALGLLITTIAGGAIGGIELIRYLAKRRKAKEDKVKTIRRRAFIGGLTCLGGILGLGIASTPLLASALAENAYETGENYEHFFISAKIMNPITPEFHFMINVRNMVIAYKMIEMMKRYESACQNQQGQPTFTLVIGMMHFEIEEIISAYSNGDLSFKDLEEAVEEIAQEDPSISLAVSPLMRYSKDTKEWKDGTHIIDSALGRLKSRGIKTKHFEETRQTINKICAAKK